MLAGALGAATCVQIKSGFEVGSMNNAYLGTDYSSSEIREYLSKKIGLNTNNILIFRKKVASDLSEGKLLHYFKVAWSLVRGFRQQIPVG